MRNIKITLEYDGTDYYGWQRQKNALSIQGLVEKVLKKVLREKINLIGAGRTDSGVHAKGQVANFRTRSELSLERIQKALNANLPKDICIKRIKEAKKTFNARFDTVGKLYRYEIYSGGEKMPLSRRYSLQIPYKLDVKAMRKAITKLLGKHDFSSFRSSNSNTKTSVRTIKKVSVRKNARRIIIDIEADGFLYNMVRVIVGTLVEIGRGKLSPLSMRKILSARNRSLAGPTVPARGLMLIKVRY